MVCFSASRRVTSVVQRLYPCRRTETEYPPGSIWVSNGELWPASLPPISTIASAGWTMNLSEASGAAGTWIIGTQENFAASALLFRNASSDRMVIQPGGNVGIGTNTPKATLDVTGGNIIVGSPGQGIILKSPNGATCRLLSIDNAGVMVLTAVACS